MTSTLRLAGVEVPRIGLGTNRLTTAPEHVAFVREAVAAGVRHIDTAHLYTGGESEQADRRRARGRRRGRPRGHQGRLPPGRGPAGGAAAQIEQSLRALRTDAIGLYYLHRVDPETPLEESLGEIKAYVDRGAIRHVGISEVERRADRARARAVVPIAAVQNEYNLGERGHDEVVDYCEREGIAFVPYYPLRDDGGPRVARARGAAGATSTRSSSPRCCGARRSSRRSPARSRSGTCRRTSPRWRSSWATRRSPSALAEPRSG